MKTETLIHLVRDWGTSREIIGQHAKATLETQFDKFLEESDELRAGIEGNDPVEITDGIGDCAVVLILLAELHGVCFEDCLAFAYNEIKNRDGKMIDGAFVKNVTAGGAL